MLPPDIHPDSRCRLPLAKRDDFDEDGKKVFDVVADPNGSIRGLIGPGGISLHSPKLAKLTRPVGKFLRFESGIAPREREIAILITARECGSQFEWAAHEPEGLKCGVQQEIINIIKYRRPTTGLSEMDDVIITLGRETFGKRKVSSETYARAIKLFGKEGLVNLVALMGNYAATAAMLCVMDMQLDDGPDVKVLPVGPG
jgi:4-carboxymuconolactone decarboxylase